MNFDDCEQYYSNACLSPRAEFEKHPVCRFLVQNVCCSQGRAKKDFTIDLVYSVDGLLTLVKSVYGILKKHQRLDESYRTLHWRLHFHGEVFTLADPEVHHFRLMQFAIYNGQTGWFEGSNASFRFTIIDMQADAICPSLINSYPKIEIASKPQQSLNRQRRDNIQKFFSGNVDDDWISDKMKEKAADFTTRFREYMGGANVWKCDSTGDYFRDHPKPPKWTDREEEVLKMLLSADLRFQESWKSMLQYSFVNRSELATSQQWYKVRKRMQEQHDSCVATHSAIQLVSQAKELCIEILQGHLRHGVPELGEHPNKRKAEVVSDSHDPDDPVEEADQESSNEGSFAHLPKRRRVVEFEDTIKRQVSIESNLKACMARQSGSR